MATSIHLGMVFILAICSHYVFIKCSSHSLCTYFLCEYVRYVHIHTFECILAWMYACKHWCMDKVHVWITLCMHGYVYNVHAGSESKVWHTAIYACSHTQSFTYTPIHAGACMYIAYIHTRVHTGTCMAVWMDVYINIPIGSLCYQSQKRTTTLSFVVWACWYLSSTSVFTMNDCTSNHCFLEKGNYYWQISQNLATMFPLLLPPRPFLPSVCWPLITNIETVIIRITEPHSPEAISSL